MKTVLPFGVLVMLASVFCSDVDILVDPVNIRDVELPVDDIDCVGVIGVAGLVVVDVVVVLVFVTEIGLIEAKCSVVASVVVTMGHVSYKYISRFITDNI